MSDELTVISTTDPQAVVEAVANDQDEDARTPAPAQKDSTVASYEHPRSERKLLLERLKQHEADLQTLTNPEDETGESIVVNEAAEGEADSDPEAAESESQADVDEIRKRATEDAVRDARRKMGLDGNAWQQQLSPEEIQLRQMRAELSIPFGARMAQIRAQMPDLDSVMEAAKTDGSPDVSPAVMDALLALPGGPEATVHLIKNPEARERLANLPDHVAVAAVADLAARLSSSGKRVRSNAPPPIRPVGGSSTKSSVPLDERPYSEYRKIRDQQEKNRYRR
jgi:hypothetical protein